jgi:hypothetical protein
MDARSATSGGEPTRPEARVEADLREHLGEVVKANSELGAPARRSLQRTCEEALNAFRETAASCRAGLEMWTRFESWPSEQREQLLAEEGGPVGSSPEDLHAEGNRYQDTALRLYGRSLGATDGLVRVQ